LVSLSPVTVISKKVLNKVYNMLYNSVSKMPGKDIKQNPLIYAELDKLFSFCYFNFSQ